MGVEDYRIVLLCADATSQDALAALESVSSERTILPRLPDSPPWHVVLDDQSHIVEAEIDGPPTRISLRFALCNQRSIDQRFLQIIDHLAQALVISIADQENKNALRIPIGSSAKSARAILDSIAIEREIWQSEFGRRTAKLSCAEALLEFVIKVSAAEAGR